MVYLSCDNMKKIIFLISIFFIGLNLVYADDTVKLSKCSDGDTFRATLNKQDIKIRMLAIDTPEIAKEGKPAEYYANEAAEYTCNRLKKAKKITLSYDPKSDKTDKYGRYLAWIYVDGKLLQEELVAKGYAKVAYLYDDYKYADILKEKQELASAKNIGIWDTDAAFKYDSSSSKETVNNEMPENIAVIIVSLLLLLFAYIAKKKHK